MERFFYFELEVGGKSRRQILSAFEAKEYKISTRARGILLQPSWPVGKKETVRFGRCKVRDLGISENPSTPDLMEWLRCLGHKPCQPADALAMRLTLGKHPLGECFWVLAEELPDSDNDPSMFSLENDEYGKPCLGAGQVDPKRGWPLNFALVFRL